ncbi:hypothetical protein NITLEN_40283 [Nitrospira lenta]|uniref:Uncharacterized protein n=1 Tax=Nitrospira lenta TaxID=1436998 RepID=A0A330L794_9BACT|nr:hypothetical protein NITLEN_40283 [Nitrospira lenta]
MHEKAPAYGRARLPADPASLSVRHETWVLVSVLLNNSVHALYIAAMVMVQTG